MNHQYISVERIEGVLLIVMDDLPTRNAIGREMASEINSELDHLEASPHLRALVITGKDPSFCSGANVKQMDNENRQRGVDQPLSQDKSAWEMVEERWKELGPNEPHRYGETTARFLPLRLHNLQKPSIAAVNGYAMGLGMGLALSCDIRIASEKAQFSEAFIKRGLVPADGSCWHLPRMIGLGNTMWLQYTGDALDATEAHRLGIVNRVTKHKDLMPTTMETALQIARGPTFSMALIKRLVQESLFKDFSESLELAGPAQDLARQTTDHREGVRAFLEKRRPLFKGR